MSFTHTKRRAGRMAMLTGAAMLLAAVAPSAVSAAGNGATIARGIQHEYGSCGDNADGYLMEGALVGCWWVDTFEVAKARGTMLAHGREHFTGCLGSVCGTFFTTYSYTARFDGDVELHGRCHHPITGGTDGFAGARGELSFTDVVDADPVYYPYWGNVQLGHGAGSAATRLAVSTQHGSGLRSAAAGITC